MPGLFKPCDAIDYVKMYSTFRNNTSEHCLAFILMPCSPQKRQLSLSSLQFDFNAEGAIPMLRIFYDGEEIQIHHQAKKTMEALDALKALFGSRQINPRDKCLTVELLQGEGAGASVAAVFELLQSIYLLKKEFAAEIKTQLLTPDYLAKNTGVCYLHR